MSENLCFNNATLTNISVLWIQENEELLESHWSYKCYRQALWHNYFTKGISEASKIVCTQLSQSLFKGVLPV